MNTDSPTPPRTGHSGKWVVIALLGFSLLMTGMMWVYWKLQLAPFLPLQEAIVAEYPGTAPRVEGGRHKKSPPILRVVLMVDFTPVEKSEKVQQLLQRIVELSQQHVKLTDYETLEIYLVHPIPERMPERMHVTYKVADLPKG